MQLVKKLNSKAKMVSAQFNHYLLQTQYQSKYRYILYFID